MIGRHSSELGHSDFSPHGCDRVEVSAGLGTRPSTARPNPSLDVRDASELGHSDFSPHGCDRVEVSAGLGTRPSTALPTPNLDVQDAGRVDLGGGRGFDTAVPAPSWRPDRPIHRPTSTTTNSVGGAR